MVAHPRHDIPPGCVRNHVARVAAEPVDTAAAPGEKHFRHEPPQVLMPVIELGQVLPLHAPGSRDLDAALRGAHQPLGVVGVQIGRPAGMVDGDVEKEPRIAAVHGVHQFDELLGRCGLGIEDGQGRVDASEAKSGIGTAEAAHAAIRGGGRVDGEQHQDAAAQLPQNEIQLADQVPEGSRGRYHRETGLVEQADARIARGGQF